MALNVYEAIGELTQFKPDQKIKVEVVGQYVNTMDEARDYAGYIVYLDHTATNVNIVSRNGECVLEVEL